MELIEYIRLFRKWFWLIFLGAFIAGSASFLMRGQQQATYSAQVTLLVGGFIDVPNPNTAEISTGVELAQTYAELARMNEVLWATIEAGAYDLTAKQLRAMLRMRIVPNTSLLVLTITYEDPIVAASVANDLAEQLILNSPSNLTPEQQAQIDLAIAEIDSLTQQLADLRHQLEVIDNQLDITISAYQIQGLEEQRNSVVEQINLASANLAQFSNNVINLRNRTNSLDVVEQAEIPTEPSSSSVLNVVILGAVVGASLAVGVALLIEYLDNTIKTPEIAVELLSVPVLGTVARFGGAKDAYTKRLIVCHHPLSPISESYRSIRTKLLFFANGQKATYIITSPGPLEGKSVTAANVAVVMALNGLQVLLIDADLRRPRVHEIFNLPNELGLSTLLYAEPLDTSNGFERIPENMRACLQDTQIPNLRVITSGFRPANPTEVLGSAAMQLWFNIFHSANNVDVILFDTPPALVVADSYTLASTIGASAVLVVDAERTRQGAALKAKEHFTELNVDVVGTVLNRANPNNPLYDYGYGYGSYYYYSDDDGQNPEQQQKSRKWRVPWKRQ